MILVARSTDHELLASLNEEVQQLHHEMHPGIFKPFNREEIAEAFFGFLARQGCYAYIAREGDTPVGYLILFIRESGDNVFQYNTRTIYIDQVGVLLKFRKKGIAELLLTQAETLARELSITRLELDHWTANTVAASYFRKQGYELCKERLCKVI